MSQLDVIRRDQRRTNKGRPRATTKRVSLGRINLAIPEAIVYMCMVDDGWYKNIVQGHPDLEEQLEVYDNNPADWDDEDGQVSPPPPSSPPRSSPPLAFSHSSDEE